ncbi:hypothetical protein ACTQ4E_05040 [Lawsonibacter sp. LCP25S3_G6]|uniref:hypothetical protein n=1 Tax=unclassified Lawsonibacter TaxID=2617946 RepID=UPI003F9E0A90
MPYKVSVDLAAVNSNHNFAILTGKSPIYSYGSDGKRTSEEPIGVKLTVALQGARLAPLTVKFDHDPLPKVTDEEIEEAVMNCQPLFVQIPDCAVSLFSSNGSGIGMTATAQTAQIVTLNSK